MKLISILGLFLVFFTLSFNSFSQVFWTETFGSGCNQGTLANGYASPNGTWTTTATGVNGALANVWYISAAENGAGVGNCGAGCGSEPTLHIGAGFFDPGAAYLTDNSLGDPTTAVRAESPIIDCSGRTDVCLSFEYIENGDGALDNHVLWYFDGTSWSVLEDTPKTPLTCAPQGQWAPYNISLPPSADGNPNVQIGFEWVNNDDGLGTDPSVAIYNIRLTGVDTQAPSMNCFANVNVFLDQDCESSIPDLTLPPFVIVWDNCTAVSDLLVTQSIPPGSVISGHLSFVNVEVTVSDLAGNTNSCIVEVRALDSIAPTLECPSANVLIYANAFCEASVPDFTTLLNPQDNCTAFGDLLMNQNPAAGTFISANQLVNFTAQDNAAEVSTCQFTLEFIDTIQPTILCPTNQTQLTSVASCDTLVLDYRGSIIWGDNCSLTPDMTFTQIPAPLDVVPQGVNTITIFAEDAAGNSNSCSFQLTVIDDVVPLISLCAPDTVQYANAACNINLGDFTGVLDATDNCSSTGNITVTQSPAPGSVFSLAASPISVTLTATDQAGNTSVCNFEVEIQDTIAPEAFCPPAATVNVNADCEYIMVDFTGGAAATDNCTSLANFTYSQAPLVGTALAAGVYFVAIDAIDESGNAGGCTFSLTVSDATAPIITDCPPAQIILLNANCEGSLGDYSTDLVAVDNCTVLIDLTVVQSPPPGTIVSAPGSTTLTVTDLSGNSAQCIVAYSVIDGIAPVVVCPADSLVAINVDCEYLVPDFSGVVNVSDNCSSVANIGYTQTPVAGSASTGAIVVTVEVTDEAGNPASCPIQIVPDDQMNPTIICPADEVVSNGTSCDFTMGDYTAVAIANDNCPGFTVTQLPVQGAEIGTGSHQVSLMVTDAVGNTAECSFELQVLESINPTIICPANIESCDAIVAYAAPTVDDNCGVAGVTQIDASGLTSGNTFPIGQTIQTYEVTDLSGNTASCSFTVEVFSFPSQATIFTTTIGLCDTTSLILEAEIPQTGSGEWSVTQGSGTLNNQFSPTTGANNLVFGANQFVWTVSTAECGSTSDTLNVTVYQLPFPAITQSDLLSCGDTSVNISANTPNIGQGSWYTVTPNVQFLNSDVPNTLAFNLTPGNNLVVWEISNGTCPVSTDTLGIFYYAPARIITSDTTLCVENNEILLIGTPAPSSVSSLWYQITGASEIEDIFASTTWATKIAGGVNAYVYAYNHPVCGATTDTVFISVELCGDFNPVIPTVFTPNNDGKNDLFVVDNLSLLYPNCQVKIVNRWGNLVFESEGYDEPWDGTNMNNGELLPAGTYFYRIWLNDSDMTEITGPISIIR